MTSLPKASRRGRPPTDRRCIIDAVLYVVKGGIQWRLLPSDFPSWKTVYHIFRQWTLNHTWASLNDALRTCVRATEDKRSRPTAAILDSQSVKSDPHGGNVGYDAAKQIKGRKRHILVDTLGLLLGVFVTPANVTERAGAQDLLRLTLGWFTWLRLLWVDGGYNGDAFAQWAQSLRAKLTVQVVKRSDRTHGFKVLPRRWVVERTFAWLGINRRMSKDVERFPETSLAFIFTAMIKLMKRRLARFLYS